MARPRKNRLGEYSKLLGEEIGQQIHEEISKSIALSHRAYREELAELRAEIRKLGRRIDQLTRRGHMTRPPLGRWVPGGPGRPPKDAAERIAAFEARSQPAAKDERVTRTRATARARRRRA